MIQDEIWVEHRKHPEPIKEIEIDHRFYAESFRYLLGVDTLRIYVCLC